MQRKLFFPAIFDLNVSNPFERAVDLIFEFEESAGGKLSIHMKKELYLAERTHCEEIQMVSTPEFRRSISSA